MARTVLEDLEKQERPKSATKAHHSPKEGESGEEKDPHAKVKLGVALGVIALAIGYFAFQQGWLTGKNKPTAEPNIAPSDVIAPPSNKPPPVIGDEEKGQIPEQPQTTTRVQGVN